MNLLQFKSIIAYLKSYPGIFSLIVMEREFRSLYTLNNIDF